MSEIDEKTDLMTELTNKINRCNKNIKELMAMVKSIDEKLNKNDDSKDKVNKSFEKRQIGRPVGSFESKRIQYYDMVVKGKITTPKQETLDYYKINKNPDDNTYHLV